MDQLREALVRAVEEKGADYVYPNSERVKSNIHETPVCQYFVGGKPSCIVGHVLYYDGVTDIDEGRAAQVVAHDLSYYGSLTRLQLMALTEVQTIQDNGGTWGKALAQYDKVMGND